MASFLFRRDVSNVARNGRLSDRLMDGKPARTVTEFRDMVRLARQLESEGLAFPRIRKGY